MAGLALVLFIQIAVCFFGTLVSERRFEEFLPLGLISSVLIVYTAGLFGILSAGAWACLLLAAALLFFSVSGLIRKKYVFDKKRFFTPAFFVFVFLTAFVIYINFGRSVVAWDEVSHWATSVKALFFRGKLYADPNACLQYAAYPPGTSILHYIAVLFNSFFSGSYCDWIPYCTYDILCVSALLPALSRIERKQWLYVPLAGLVLFLLPMFFFDEMYALLQVELLMPLLVFYLLWLFIFDERKDVFRILFRLCAIAMLVLVKESGLYFAVSVPVAFLIVDLIRRRKENLAFRDFIPYFIYAAVVLFLELSWKGLLQAGKVKIEFGGKIDILMFIRLIFGLEKGWQRDIFSGFWKELLKPVIKLGAFSISFVMLFAVLLVLTAALFFFCRSKKQSRLASCLIVPPVISLGYIVGVCAVYVFKFGMFALKEDDEFPSLPRYSKVAYIMWTLLIVIFLVYFLMENRARIGIVLLAVVSIFTACWKSNLVRLCTRQSILDSRKEEAPYIDTAVDLKRNIPPDKKVYILTQDEVGYSYYMLAYKIYPVSYNVANEDLFCIGKNNRDPYYTQEITCSDWMKRLQDTFDYVFVYTSNETLKSEYAAAFRDSVAEKGLYAVNADGTLSYQCTCR